MGWAWHSHSPCYPTVAGGAAFFADSGTVVLLSVALIQALLHTAYGGLPFPRFILSLLTPFTFTVLALRSGASFMLTPALAGYWAFALAFGLAEALSLALSGRFAARLFEGFVAILNLAAFFLAWSWLTLGGSEPALDAAGFLSRIAAFPVAPYGAYPLFAAPVLALALATGRRGLTPQAVPAEAAALAKRADTPVETSIETPESPSFDYSAEPASEPASEPYEIPPADKAEPFHLELSSVYGTGPGSGIDSQAKFPAGCAEYCVLHAGLWGLSDLVETMGRDGEDPEASTPLGTVDMLAEYFAEWALCAEDFGGFPASVTGGSVVLLFGGAKRSGKCKAAVECALSMRERWPSVRTRLAMGGVAVPERFGAGLAIGSVLVGEVRAGNAVTLGALGPAATEAARLVAAHDRVRNDFCLTAGVMESLNPDLQSRFVRLGSLGSRNSPRQSVFYGIKDSP